MTDGYHWAGCLGEEMISKTRMEVSSELRLSVHAEDNQTGVLTLRAFNDFVDLHAMVQLE